MIGCMADDVDVVSVTDVTLAVVEAGLGFVVVEELCRRSLFVCG